MRLQIAILILFGLVCAGGGYIVGTRTIGGPSHAIERRFAIAQQAKIVPHDGVVLVGDSLTGQAYLPALCGLAVFNAGISGAKLADVVPLVKDVADAMEPRLLILMIGTNDALGDTNMAAWETSLAGLMQATMQRTRLLVVTPPPMNNALHDAPRIAARLAQLQASVRTVAARLGVGTIDLAAAFGPNLAADETVDGIHFSPAGYAVWRQALEAAACRPEQ